MLKTPSQKQLLFIVIVLLFLNLLMSSKFVGRNKLSTNYTTKQKDIWKDDITSNRTGFASLVRHIMEVEPLTNDKIPNSKRKSFTQCDEISNDEAINYFGNVTSSMKNWTFQNKISCPTRIIGNTFTNKSRRMFSIRCTYTSVKSRYTYTINSDEVQEMKFGDQCLNRYIQKCCLGEQRVPNVVHYVWYKRGELSFVPFLSLLGVIRFVKPCVIVFHGAAPYGKYWDAFTYLWPRVILLKREAPVMISNKYLRHREHASDFMRIEALIKYGGIYMDTDTVLVKSVDKLRNYSCVMSEQSSGLMGSAFVMSEKNGTFVNKWMDGYRYNYIPEKYAYNAMVYPKKLKTTLKDHIHVEYATISRPVGMIGGTIYWNSNATYDWSYIYGIHLYSRIYKEPVNETTIRHMNFTFGSIARHVYYGNKELCL
ncbi:hypothetical protein ACF0H5_004377 [Mactra antiquata]